MPSSPARPALVIGVLASCGLAVSLTQTLVVPLLPRFPQLLSASPATVTWLVTATLVAGAVCAPVLGRLGDMFGKRRMLLVALGMVSVGSALGIVAPNVWVLIGARALQGASLGVIALGISIIRDVLPSERVGSGVALMSSSLGVGGAIGLPLTGLVAEAASWRWLFAGAAVLGLAQLVLVRLVVQESPLRTGGRFDVVGALGLSAALVSLLLAISQGSVWGWGSAQVLGLLVAAAVLFAAWGRWELRVVDPLVDLRVSARPSVLLTNVGSILIGFAIFAGFMLTTQVLQAVPASGYGFGLSLLAAGMALLPVGASMMVFSQVSARISERYGARATIVVGTVVLAAGNILMATLPGSVPLVICAATISAVGAALAYAALPLLIMDAVPPGQTAAANSLNTLMRMLGTSSCSAFAAAVSTGFVQVVGGNVMPSGLAFTIAFAAAAGAALAAMTIAALTPRAPAAPPPAFVSPVLTRGG